MARNRQATSTAKGRKKPKAPMTLSERFKQTKTTKKPLKKMNPRRNKNAKKAMKVVKAKPTAESLDMSLDKYMMQDKQVAQAKLDDDLDTYMMDIAKE